MPSIYRFTIPGTAALELAFHRRGNKYYVVFPRAYGMMASREFCSLNEPRSNNPEETAPPTSHPHLNRRIWFNTDSSMLTLEKLLAAESLDPDQEAQELLKVTGTSKMEKAAGRGEQPDIEANQVEIILSEDRFCWRCAYCGGWESEGYTNDDERYQKVGQDGDDAVYWCGVRKACCYSDRELEMLTSVPFKTCSRAQGNALKKATSNVAFALGANFHDFYFGRNPWS
jgi:hypothetical protein